MTIGVSSYQTTQPPAQVANPVDASRVDLPDEYEAIRADADTQFAQLKLKEIEPREPSWFENWLNDLFEWLADIFGPVGRFMTDYWDVLKWAFVVLIVAFVVYGVARLIGPLADRRGGARVELETEPDWQPDREESLALLEDADRLAAEGRFDEAARLLLQRSVGQIAAARPEWVDPSSTARELAALPRLSDAARRAFAVISEAVERSLFALKTLTRDDWEAARSAYADFALARIDAGRSKGNPMQRVGTA
ncbi:MAG: hypothetical protein AAGA34_04345 [Pseudomonadota bacterium]